MVATVKDTTIRLGAGRPADVLPAEIPVDPIGRYSFRLPETARFTIPNSSSAERADRGAGSSEETLSTLGNFEKALLDGLNNWLRGSRVSAGGSDKSGPVLVSARQGDESPGPLELIPLNPRLVAQEKKVALGDQLVAESVADRFAEVWQRDPDGALAMLDYARRQGRIDQAGFKISIG